ncbi:hypothetical protein Scep_007880 [Stephania cephalantha]|uniref:Uncharacterized protein n=1 Tax=Stephania cephalantha TaxID=152367 RepID=A0AAP0PLJ0_9MAGN
MSKGLLGSRNNTVQPSHPFLQGLLGESWMRDGTKSPGHFEEPLTHGGIKSPTHIYYIMMIGQQGDVIRNETLDLHLYLLYSMHISYNPLHEKYDFLMFYNSWNSLSLLKLFYAI